MSVIGVDHHRDSPRIGAGAEKIEGIDWLRGFSVPWFEAWNSHDANGVTACVSEDVFWTDPAAIEPIRGRAELAAFMRESWAAVPDMKFSEPGEPAIAEGGLAAYVPWRMTGTNTGPIDPPGFAATGKSIDLIGFDVWQFRGGLVWRYAAYYDFTELSRQLGLQPPPGGMVERAMVAAQRVQARLRR